MLYNCGSVEIEKKSCEKKNRFETFMFKACIDQGDAWLKDENIGPYFQQLNH